DYAIVAAGLPRDIWQTISQPKNTMRDVKSRLRNIVATGLPRDIWQLISQPKNTMRDIKSRLRNIVAAGLPRDIWQLTSQPKKHDARYKIATTIVHQIM
uniref:hypothetical protein n=1 Tax=Pseudoalteromonas sp. TAB23 TaxID=1938595 RepID=UPI0004656C62